MQNVKLKTTFQPNIVERILILERDLQIGMLTRGLLYGQNYLIILETLFKMQVIDQPKHENNFAINLTIP